MKVLVEAFANVALFILTPVVVVWIQSRVVMVIETLGTFPVEEDEAHALYFLGGKHEQVRPSGLAQAAADGK